jgi:hypothetical protein
MKLERVPVGNHSRGFESFLGGKNFPPFFQIQILMRSKLGSSRALRSKSELQCAKPNCKAVLQKDRRPSYFCTCALDYCDSNCCEGKCGLESRFSGGAAFCVLKKDSGNGPVAVVSRDVVIEVTFF